MVFLESLKFHTFQAYSEAHTLQTHSGLLTLLRQTIPFARFYLGSFASLWMSNHIGRVLFLGISLVLVGVGLCEEVKQRIPIHLLFAGFYLPLIVYSEEARYLIPLIPLYFLYIIKGVQRLIVRTRDKVGALAPAVFAGVLVSAIAVSYLDFYLTTDLHHLPVSTESVEAQQVFAFIKSHASARDVVEFASSRTMALYTERRSSEYPRVPLPTLPALSEYFCRTGITYLVTTALIHEPVFDQFVALNRANWTLELSNRTFNVYAISQSCKLPPTNSN